MVVALYIYVDGIAKRIELFDDEKISIDSSVQDIADVSVSKIDYTQAFTIPASDNNNEIFKHWYENAIDGGFDQRIKYDGYIEIDTIFFREGGFALNNVKFKNNRPENYTINFYGKGKNIKDLLKEDNLRSLDFSGLNHAYNYTQIVNRITTNDANVAYPLFAHDRIYNYGGGGTTDVTHESGAIRWNTLFPAVKLSYILQKINDKYGVSFSGAFLEYIQVSKLWMLFKNTESLTVQTEPLKINFTSKTGLTDKELNLTTDEIGFDTGFTSVVSRSISITTVPSSGVVAYDVLIYKNGTLFNSYFNLTGTKNSIIFSGIVNTQNKNDKYTVYVQSATPISFTTTLFYNKFSFVGTDINTATSPSQTTVANINIGNYAPEIKLIDLIGGLIKMFSLVIIQKNDSFELIPLELYYANGKYRELKKKNVITDDHEFKKTSMYKNINFKFQKSENILNSKFNELFLPARGYDYGDISYEQINSLESNTFTVELPFENPMYERKSDSNFQTITFKNKDLQNYVPKPMLMYDNGQQTLTTDIKIETNSHVNISTYRRFSNDLNNGGLITLNFGDEISSWTLSSISEGLYKKYYSNYLGNIFNIKGRLLVQKCHFNPIDLADIKLNDRIIIRDKRYTINKLSCELTSGEVTLELLTDYRDVDIPVIETPSAQPIYIVDNTANEIQVLVLLNGYDYYIVDDAGAYPWISVDGAGFPYYDNTNFLVSISANTTGLERTGLIPVVYELNGVTTELQIPIIQNA